MGDSGEVLSLAELAELLFKGVPIATNTSGVLGLRRHANTFVGRDAITWLVSQGHAPSRAAAARLGNSMIAEGLFRHVKDPAQPLKDKATSLYRFHVHSKSGDLPTSPGSVADSEVTSAAGSVTSTASASVLRRLFSKKPKSHLGRSGAGASAANHTALDAHDSHEFNLSHHGHGNGALSSVSSPGGSLPKSAYGLAVPDRRAVVRLGNELAGARQQMSALEARLTDVESSVEGRTLFDMVLGFVFRDGLGVAVGATPDSSQAVQAASFLDVLSVILRTMALLAGLLLSARCMETMLRFVVGQESVASFLASVMVVLGFAAAVSVLFVRARTIEDSRHDPHSFPPPSPATHLAGRVASDSLEAHAQRRATTPTSEASSVMRRRQPRSWGD